MGTSPSVPVDIEAFRPAPGERSFPQQQDVRSARAAGEPATAAAVDGSGLPRGTERPSCAPTTATTVEIAASSPGVMSLPVESISHHREVAVPLRANDNGGGGHDGGDEAVGGVQQVRGGGIHSLPDGVAVARRADPGVAGEGPRVTSISAGHGGGIARLEEENGEEDTQERGEIRRSSDDTRIGPSILGVSVANVDNSSLRPASAEATTHDAPTTAPRINAAATLDDVDPGLAAGVVGDSIDSSVAPMSMVTTATTAVGFDSPLLRQSSVTLEALSAPPPPPATAAAVTAHAPTILSFSGGYPPSQPFVVRTPPPLIVGTESGSYSNGSGAAQIVSESMSEPPRPTAVGAVTSGMPNGGNEYLLQIPPLTHQAHSLPPVSSPSLCPAVAGAEEGLVFSTASAAPGAPSVASQPYLHRHHHPLLLPQPPPPPPPLPLAPPAEEATEIDVGTEGRAAPSQAVSLEMLVDRAPTTAVSPHHHHRHHQQDAAPVNDGHVRLSQGERSKGGSASVSASRPSKRRARRPCGTEGCKRRPIFGVEGTRRAQFCATHKPDGFVNVLCKQCDAEGCKHQPSFGVPGGKPIRCATHRSEGMVNLSAPRCVAPGCRVVPSFATRGAKRASACAAHRKDGDVDVVSRRCHHEGCVHRPVFGFLLQGEGKPAERKAHYCSTHKLDGMINVFVARCATESCTRVATFGPPRAKKPSHCAEHRDQAAHERRR